MRRRRRSTIMQAAVDEWRGVREEFEQYRQAAYSRALEHCRGSLLNARGKRNRIDSYSLFIGNEVRALAYASPELVEHWTKHPRPVFARFESAYSRNLRSEHVHG